MQTSAWCLVVAVVFVGLTAAQAEAALGPCGDGYVDPGEQCDDGNTLSGDGCSPSCFSELCGDGNTQTALGEECDDGNLIGGDGCSALCMVEVPCSETADCVLHYRDSCGWDNCGGITPGVCDPPIPMIHGDVTGRGIGSPPDGIVNVFDLRAEVTSFKEFVGDSAWPNAAVVWSGSCPGHKDYISIQDLSAVRSAFGPIGEPSTLYGCDCPANPY